MICVALHCYQWQQVRKIEGKTYPEGSASALSEMGERMEEEKIILTGDDGEEIACYILEETKVAGCNYVLVTDSEDEYGDCYILKDVSAAEEPEAVYEVVEDEKEQQYLARIFNELLEDVDIQS